MIVYRIGHCEYINDLSGRGAALIGARWNSRDVYVLYTAQSRALSLLEVVVHIGKVPANNNYCMLTLDIPDTSIETISPAQLPADWTGNPPPDYLKKYGDNFIAAGNSLALRVPSVLMPEEYNFLLNPAHPDFKKVKIVSQRTLTLDDRLFPVGRA